MNDSYIRVPPEGRVYDSFAESEAIGLQPGDTVLVRRLDELLAEESRSYKPEYGKWQIRDYSLSDGSGIGKMLIINQKYMVSDEIVLPPEITIKPGLTGWYAIWLGIPSLKLKPLMANSSGIDIALNDEPFVHIGPERGTRKGTFIKPADKEVMCFFKCACLDGAVIKLRIPYGTFLPYPLGLVRAVISSLKLVKLSDVQISDWRADISNPGTKRVISVHDGFSPYWNAIPGNDTDARYAETFRDSDIKMIMLQTPCTGTAAWPSKITSLLGEGLTEEEWAGRRYGDRRVQKYFKWAVENGREGFRVMSEYCRRYGMEFHLSIRMNLFFSENNANNKFGSALEKYFNGSWWLSHPELRLESGLKLDYSKKEARQFILYIINEVAGMYEVDGVNLDFTRWPPVFDVKRHDDEVATTLVKEVRELLSAIEAQNGRKLQLSICAADGYHAAMTLEEQRINLEKLLCTGTLDFICIEAWDHMRHISLARKYGVGYYALQDQESIDVEGGWRNDPAWKQADRENEDPLPGEENEEQIPVNSTLDPVEYDRAASKYYRLGADGICIFNNFYGWKSQGRLGHSGELEERISAGKVWGQEYGPEITVATDNV